MKKIIEKIKEDLNTDNDTKIKMVQKTVYELENSLNFFKNEWKVYLQMILDIVTVFGFLFGAPFILSYCFFKLNFLSILLFSIRLLISAVRFMIVLKNVYTLYCFQVDFSNHIWQLMTISFIISEGSIWRNGYFVLYVMGKRDYR